MELLEIRRELRTTPTMRAWAVDSKCQLIVKMPPQDFLKLTTIDGPEEFQAAAQPLYMYNRWAKVADRPEYRSFLQQRSSERVYGINQAPFLRIAVMSKRLGKVVSHEGRHRAGALLNQKTAKMPVALCLRPGRDYHVDRDEKNRYTNREYLMSSKDLPDRVLGEFTAIEMSSADWEIVEGDMLARFRR